MNLEGPPAVDAAVIDVGSNSVRLVVYRLEGRAIWTVYNEKVLAGLGRDMAETGKLSPAGVEQALAALRRFKALLGSSKPDLIFAVATAAVREAKDGKAFAKTVREKIGFDLRVLSGPEEAHYAALGVVAGFPGAAGVVADLGGASLELTQVSKGKPGKGKTFPVGPFSLGGGDFELSKVEKKVAQRLKGTESFASDTLHAVGGAWRNLALIHMRMTGYPLEIVHQYSISGVDAVSVARFVSRQSKGSLERMGGASKKRAETMPHAAVVLAELIERLKISRVVISAFGLREGLLLESMPAAVRRQDPLSAGAAALGGRRFEAEALGAGIEAWLKPAFSTLPPAFEERDGALLAAACRLAELGARLHPDHRATLAFEQVLRAPIAGQTHRERAFLATTVFNRHTAIADPPEPHTLARLLDFHGERRAKTLGAAIRLACDLCGRNPALLKHASLEFSEQTVVVTADKAHADLLLGEQTRRRAQTLASTLGRDLEIRTA